VLLAAVVVVAMLEDTPALPKAWVVEVPILLLLLLPSDLPVCVTVVFCFPFGVTRGVGAACDALRMGTCVWTFSFRGRVVS